MPAQLFLNILLSVLPLMPNAGGSVSSHYRLKLPGRRGGYSDVQAVDGSTLDALIRTIGLLKDLPQNPLAGKITALLEPGKPSSFPNLVRIRPQSSRSTLLAADFGGFEGQYLNTLTCTDLSTGWTDVTALPHRSQEAVSKAIHLMRQRLPFPLLGIDSDNGSGSHLRRTPVQVSTTCCIVTVWMRKSLSPVLAHTRKTTRHMSNRRIGP